MSSPRILDLAAELPVGVEPFAQASVLGRQPGCTVAVIPEPGRSHVLLELVEARVERRRVKGTHEPRRAGP